MLCNFTANICYLTGFETIDHFGSILLLVPAEGDPTLLVSDFEAYNVLAGAWLEDVVIFKKFGDPVDMDTMVLVANESPESDLVSQDNRQRLYAALEKLPAKQRAVITLKVEQGLSYQEISQVLGGTAGAARVNYCQALKTLKKIFHSEDEHEVAMRPSAAVAARVPRR